MYIERLTKEQGKNIIKKLLDLSKYREDVFERMAMGIEYYDHMATFLDNEWNSKVIFLKDYELEDRENNIIVPQKEYVKEVFNSLPEEYKNDYLAGYKKFTDRKAENQSVLAGIQESL